MIRSLSCIAAPILSIGTAAAQVASAPASPAPAPVAKQQDGEGLQDIVVTAQRRSQRLEDVPISITAVDSAKLTAAGVASTTDLALVVPGLVWGKSTINSQPTIRGVGSRNSGAGDEPSVATYIDGIYVPE
jgi:iron complex outermembrane receptor protein